MTRAAKITEATRLRAEGQSYEAIGRTLGVTGSCVKKWLNPEVAREWRRRSEARSERKAAKLAWAHEHDRGECPCGAPTGVGATRKGVLVCHDSHEEMVAVGTAMREERIAEMWARGFKLREIAEALDSTTHSIGAAMSKMRRRGWDVPRRNNWTPEGLERAQNSARRAA